MDSPWKPTEEQTAAWLQEQGFRPKKLVEPAWTAADKQHFEEAVLELAQGKLKKPFEEMKTAHFLSHHVMELRHSEQSCKRMLRTICRGSGDAMPIADASSSESEGDDSADSEEEVELHAPLHVG